MVRGCDQQYESEAARLAELVPVGDCYHIGEREGRTREPVVDRVSYHAAAADRSRSARLSRLQTSSSDV